MANTKNNTSYISWAIVFTNQIVISHIYKT